MSVTEQDVKNLWFQVGQRFADDNPAFVKTWNYVVLNSRPWQVHPYVNPVAQLIEYLRSLMDVCQQSLYSVEQIKELRDEEKSNVTIWYVSFHFYNFITRVKTATDLLALLIRHIFAIDETKLKDEECSLHKSRIIGVLRNYNPTPLKKDLANTLDATRREWLVAFYPLRNLVIHQPGLLFTSAAYFYPEKWSEGSHINIPFPYKDINSPITINNWQAPLDTLKPFVDAGEPLSVFLQAIKSKSVNPANNLNVEPIILCEEIWSLLSKLIDKVITLCHLQVLTFMTNNEDIGKP